MAAAARRRPAPSNAFSAQAAASTTASSASTASRARMLPVTAARPPARSISRCSRPRSPASVAISSANASCCRCRVTSASAAARAASSPRRARRRTASCAAASISAASSGSMTVKCGASPASSGNRRNSDWQKAWMVWIFMPPGVSSTRANSRRAWRHRSASGASPVNSVISSRNTFSAQVAHRPSRSAIRFATSAAAALVKVRHSSRSGAAPATMRLSPRPVSTVVLPVPADACTHTEALGCSARRRATAVSSTCSSAAITRPPRRCRPTIP